MALRFSILCILFVCVSLSFAQQRYTCSNVSARRNARSISQFGIGYALVFIIIIFVYLIIFIISFNFDKEYVVGQFANGDYWVLGPVRV